jgi:beta-mannosidase
LGILVWQDVMLANFDYPLPDPGFRAALDGELAQLGADLGGRPSLAVVCGSSEVEQQAAMMGAGGGSDLAEHLAGRVAALELDAAWVPSAPSGGSLPFRPGTGVANYYGVGGYRRDLGDARRAGVRFAAECLAFANVGEESGPPQGPDWKRGVPRDHGSSWDFEDVRDHYLALLHDVDPAQLRASDPERYLERSRAVSGEVMAAVLGEWRRAGSPCGGALVLWLRDLLPGSGWGIVDHTGVPKAAFHHLRRACAPLAVWLVDEGLGGLAVHVANDGPRVEHLRLRVALYRDLEHVRDDVEEALELDPHGVAERDVEGMLGRFVDASQAYRFGPPGHDAVVATLERDGRVLSQAFAFPAGRPRGSESAERLGLRAQLARDGDAVVLAVTTRRLAYGVRVHAPGLVPDDDAFSVEPGGRREIALRGAVDAADVRLSALNLDGHVRAGWTT